MQTDQRDEGARKGAHCAWQIHYLQVKYRKALLDEGVTTMIQEAAVCGYPSTMDSAPTLLVFRPAFARGDHYHFPIVAISGTNEQITQAMRPCRVFPHPDSGRLPL
jgi:hypothetical protein